MNTCFILMPFRQTGILQKEDLDYIYEDIIKKAVEEYDYKNERYFQIVERYSSAVGSIINGIVDRLLNAQLVIADLTGLNPNVMYELGVRHSLKRGTIIITQDLNCLPSDLRDYMTLEYSYSQDVKLQKTNFRKFKERLHATITELIESQKFDSPVLHHIRRNDQYFTDLSKNLFKENLIISGIVYDEFEEIQDIIKDVYEKGFEKFNEDFLIAVFNTKLNNLTTALGELQIPITSTILYETLINAKTLLNELMKLFVINNMLPSLNDLISLEENVFTIKPLKDRFEEPILNNFSLLYTEYSNITFTTFVDIFKKDGVLQEELFDEIAEYFKAKAIEYNIGFEEIEKLRSS